MIDKLVGFIQDVWQHLIPFAVLNQFEQGLILRFGKYQRSLGPGLHFKIPFIEELWHDTVVPRTRNLLPQTLTTLDGKTVVVSAVITNEITDIKKALLLIDGVDDAMEDICYGVISEAILERNWDEILTQDLSALLSEVMSKVGEQYGIRIINVQFQDLAHIKTYRLMR